MVKEGAQGGWPREVLPELVSQRVVPSGHRAQSVTGWPGHCPPQGVPGPAGIAVRRRRRRRRGVEEEEERLEQSRGAARALHQWEMAHWVLFTVLPSEWGQNPKGQTLPRPRPQALPLSMGRSHVCSAAIFREVAM